MKTKAIYLMVTIFAILATVLSACAIVGPTSPSADQSGNTGTVQMWVTDAPRSDNVTEIWVTVKEVKIHKAVAEQEQNGDEGSGETEGEVDDSEETGEWITASFVGSNRFELLALRGETGGLQQILAAADLAPGKYTQIRMTIQDTIEVKIDGVLKDATLPSGKLKFVHPFYVEADKETKLLFDFDADKLVHVTGSPKEPKIMVTPVVKMIVSKPQAAQSGVKITTPSLPNGAVGTAYTATLTASGGTPPYAWTILAGNLPTELTLDSTGDIAGTPGTGTAGNYTFTVKVSDSSPTAKTDTKEYTVTIADEGVLIITTTNLPDGNEGVPYAPVALAALGGTPPYIWSITSGNLPDGLKLESGAISGTPTKKGTYNFAVQATDSASPANTDTQQLSIRIVGA